LKVLQLTREYPPDFYGGAGVVVGQLSRSLAKIMDVEVRCWGKADRDDGGIPVRAYRAWERLGAVEGGPRFAPALEALSINLAMARDETDADVVHAHTWYADFGAFLVRELYRAPLVVTLHSMEPLRPWKKDQLGTGYRLSSWIEKMVVETADRVVAVSKGMRDDILRLYRADPERVVVVHNGIDPERYRRTERREALDRLGIAGDYVLFVGRIADQKGIFDLVEAAGKLPEGVTVVLCAASPDTHELEERMRKAVSGRPNIRWIYEMLKPDETVELYSHARVFCCPSVYEPFGIINLEAMGCGCPVVATAVGGILEVVVDGETGLLVPPSKPDALAAALNQVLADPELGRRMGAAGRARVEAHFSWDRVAASTAALYRDAKVGARHTFSPGLPPPA
jgi:alpha-maltose-1-phosphate synthase